jgi:hypothetical protein
MKSSTFGLKVAAAVIALAAWSVSSSAFAQAHFMLDVEAGTATPGQAGGKTATTTGGVVTMSIYGLFQGTSASATNYLIANVASWFHSSNGGLLGDLTAAHNSTYDHAGQDGTQYDVDSDGDLDIGASFDTDSFFNGGTGAQTGTVKFGHRDGTITAAVAATLDANAPATGNDYAYALIGTLTFTPISPSAGQATTVQELRYVNATGGNTNGGEQAQDLGVGAGTGANIGNGRFVWNGSAGPTSSVLQGAGIVITVVPEPATLVLAGLGALGLSFVGLRRMRRA